MSFELDPPLDANTTNSMKFINGYYENWTSGINMRSHAVADPNYYIDDFAAMTHVFYSFLTLAKVPNPDHPQVAHWDGHAIYESMT